MVLSLFVATGDWRIVPGVRVGGLKIGTEERAALKPLGKPSGGNAAAGHHWTTWTGKDGGKIDVYAATVDHGRPEVVSIRATSPRFRLPNGLKTGMPSARFQKGYPEAKRAARYAGVELYDAKAKGIGWEARNGRVVAIIVHIQGEDGNDFDHYRPMPWEEN